jgi:hypothetical protein
MPALLMGGMKSGFNSLSGHIKYPEQIEKSTGIQIEKSIMCNVKYAQSS